MASRLAPAPPPVNNATKLYIPISVALGAGWVIASLVYGAGSKVSSSEKDIAFLTARVDALTAEVKTQNAALATALGNRIDGLGSQVQTNHDASIRLDQRLASVEAAEQSKAISVEVQDSPKRK